MHQIHVSFSPVSSFLNHDSTGPDLTKCIIRIFFHKREWVRGRGDHRYCRNAISGRVRRAAGRGDYLFFNLDTQGDLKWIPASHRRNGQITPSFKSYISTQHNISIIHAIPFNTAISAGWNRRSGDKHLLASRRGGRRINLPHANDMAAFRSHNAKFNRSSA
jgi:hypothetical protein